MGCGNGKVLPEAPERGYVSVVRSLVAFSRARGDDEPKKRRSSWFSTGVDHLQPASTGRQQVLREGPHRDKVAKYKDKFDARVTAR